MAIQRTTNSDKVEKFLRTHGLGDNATSAFLGNLYKESGIVPTNLQNRYNTRWKVTDAEYVKQVDAGTWIDPIKGRPFTSDAGGFGIAQWTSSGRKTGLYNYSKAYGSSIGDLTMQLNWLWNEINSSAYKSLMKVLKANESVKACSDAIVKLYERPANQTESNLAKRAAAGEEYHALYYGKVEEPVKVETTQSTVIQTTITETIKEDSSMVVMSDAAFLEKLKFAASKKTLYVLGCFGAPMNSKNKARYTKNNSYNKGRADMINAASADTFGFDCVGLIKGILWGWDANVSKNYGGAAYKANGVPDVGANSMMNKYCTNVRKDFSDIEPGEAVWMDGHIGVYVGDGKVIECTPKWSNKVQYSNLGNIAKYKTGHYRVWTKCGKLPWISYASDRRTVEEVKAEEPVVETPVVETKVETPVVTTPEPAVEVKPVVETKPVEEVKPAAKKTYNVVKGDTLSKIGKKTGVAWKTIASINGIKFPYIVRVGMVLRLEK